MKDSYKLIIAGGRDFFDADKLNSEMDRIWKEQCFPADHTYEIVSGGAKGADALGEAWAKSKGLDIKVFEADWKTHPRAAGPIRNKQMAEYADGLVAFWDKKSKGTKNMIDTALKMGLVVVVIEVKV